MVRAILLGWPGSENVVPFVLGYFLWFLTGRYGIMESTLCVTLKGSDKHLIRSV